MAIPSTSSFGPFHGSNVDPFGQTMRSASNFSTHPFFCTATPSGSPIGGSAFPERQWSPFGSISGNQCLGSAIASYSATLDLEVDGVNSQYSAVHSRFSAGKIMSISAMPVYKNKSHEELRSKDYDLHKRIAFSIQNRESAFGQSNSLFGSRTLPVPSGQSSFGSLSGLASGTTTAAFLTDSSVKPPFGSMNAVFGVSSSSQFGSSTGNGNVDRDPRVSAAGASSTNIFGGPSNSGVGFNSTPTILHPYSGHGSTSLISGLSNMPPFAPASASSEFEKPISGFPFTSGITSAPSSWSTSPLFLSGPSTCVVGAPSTSNYSISTTSGFPFSSASASGGSSIFGYQTSSGSVRNLCQACGVASCFACATREVCTTDNMYPVEELQSISAISIYKDKSHEELRLEDYETRNKGKSHGDTENSIGLINDTSIQKEDLSSTLNWRRVYVASVMENHEANVLALMPKLPEGEYYVKPSMKELVAKEMAEPGFCSHVNDFVVGRQGYGSIKFLGETDIRHLDLESIVRFNNREMIVYPDVKKKPPVGQSLNKPAEVTLLNVKCICKKTGKQYVEGLQVHNYKELLIKKTSEQGTEFISYDPVRGEWKFRVHLL